MLVVHHQYQPLILLTNLLIRYASSWNSVNIHVNIVVIINNYDKMLCTQLRQAPDVYNVQTSQDPVLIRVLSHTLTYLLFCKRYDSIKLPLL